MDRLHAVKIFLTIAETGSFTATADKLDLSKPMVSRAVALLEEWFNARLLQRTTRQVSLTEAGEQAVEYCQKIAALTEGIEQDFMAHTGKLQGQLRIASNASFGNTHLLYAVQDFLKIHPKLNVQLMISDHSVNLVEERIDLAIRITSTPDPSLVARPLADCCSLLVATPDYLQQKGIPQRPEDLVQHHYLAHANINRKQWKFYRNGIETVLELTSRFTTNDTSALLNAVLSDGGIAMLPIFLLEQPLAEGKLVAVLPDWQLPEHKIYALYPSRHRLPIAVRALVDFLVERFKGKAW